MTGLGQESNTDQLLELESLITRQSRTQKDNLRGHEKRASATMKSSTQILCTALHLITIAALTTHGAQIPNSAIEHKSADSGSCSCSQLAIVTKK
ncbi:hypothetical protein ACLKA7_014412 [Drosophila subpalustris]